MWKDLAFQNMHTERVLNAKERNKIVKWMIFLNRYTTCNFSESDMTNPKIEHIQNVEATIINSKLKDSFDEIISILSFTLPSFAIIAKSFYITSNLLSLTVSAQVIYQVFIPWKF